MARTHVQGWGMAWSWLTGSVASTTTSVGQHASSLCASLVRPLSMVDIVAQPRREGGGRSIDRCGFERMPTMITCLVGDLLWSMARHLNRSLRSLFFRVELVVVVCWTPSTLLPPSSHVATPHWAQNARSHAARGVLADLHDTTTRDPNSPTPRSPPHSSLARSRTCVCALAAGPTLSPLDQAHHLVASPAPLTLSSGFP